MKYFSTAAIQNGGPFRCFVCDSILALQITGSDFKLKLFCKRCKTFVFIKVRLPLKFVQDIREQEKAAGKEKVFSETETVSH